MDEEDEEKTFCFVKGLEDDSIGIVEREEIHENVWYKMKPPRKSRVINPFVSARQIALVRAILTGKQSFRVEPPKPDLPINIKPVPRKPSPPVLSLNKKKSSVKFLNKFVYE